MISKTGVLSYRILVFSSALFYMIYILIVSDWTQPGGPSRYLTVWGLFFSLLISWRVLQNSRGRGNNRWDVFVSSSAIINAMVVFLYWKLFFEDPMSVTTNGQLDVWWREYYMHLVGPVLMWIDALFINRVFQKVKKTILWLTATITTYIVWIEFVVRPLNDSPVGKVTNGLPYPFLNDLFLFDRLSFYVVNFIVAMMFLALFTIIAQVFRRVFVS
jgi:hypothetical protein